MSLILQFSQGPLSAPARLVFGGEAVAPATLDGAMPGLRVEVAAGLTADRYATVDGAMPALALDAFAAPGQPAALDGSMPGLALDALVGPMSYGALDGSMPGLSVAVGLYQDLNVSRPTVGRVAPPWQSADRSLAGVQSPSRAPRPVVGGPAAPWSAGVRVSSQGRVVTPGSLRPARGWTSVRHAGAVPVRGSAWSGFEGLARVPLGLESRFQDAVPLRESAQTGFQDRYRDRRPSVASPFSRGLAARSGAKIRHQAGVPVSRTIAGVFQDAMRPPSGYARPPVDPPVKPPCYTPSGRLVFSDRDRVTTALFFFCENHPPPPSKTVTVPVREVYMVTNNVTLLRLSDGAPIPVLTASLRVDVDSWSWVFQATVHGASLPLVEPGADGPVELLATINGTTFHVLAERVSRERIFNQSAVHITGRSRNAVLDAPYAASQSFTNTGARTTQQLMADVLTLNGVPLGWTIDWGLDAWNVPAGVFSHQGSYISALLAIAQAGGGYLLPHSDEMSFKVRPRYPVAPWEWAGVTPDYVLPADLVVRESMAWNEKPAYNRVYVSGQSQGVLGRVTRAGSAGDSLAPMVVDQLITTAAAARQRGLSVLADTGRQVDVGLSLPVLAETGIILPGSFVRYQDGGVSRMGLVRSVDVDCNFPIVRQTLGVETHA